MRRLTYHVSKGLHFLNFYAYPLSVLFPRHYLLLMSLHHIIQLSTNSTIDKKILEERKAQS